MHLTDGERRSLAELGKRLGKQALDEIASIVNPDTILGWHRRLVAKKFDSSENRPYPRRPRIDADIEELVVHLAKENNSWGYDRIAGALANVGYEVADQTVGNILKRHGIPLAPERRKTTTWREFIRSHMDVLAATDFFTTQVWTQGGLVTLCLLFIHPRDGDHGYTQPERAPGGRAVSGRTLQPLGPHSSMTGVDSTSLATSWSMSRYERRTREERRPFEAC